MPPERLKKNFEFKNIYRNGRTVVSKNIVLYYCPNKTKFNRLGFSISKKTGNSVTRNRIRRIYREAFKRIEDHLLLGYDFIIIARKPAADVSYNDACEELLKLCRKKSLVKEHTTNAGENL